MIEFWRICMLGALTVSNRDSTISRFRTRRVALLLVQLALFRNRTHFRDEVGELLWPEIDPDVMRRNLRQALSSLRHALEPPPLPTGSVLEVHQARLRLNPKAVTTDVAEFEAAINESKRATTPLEQKVALEAAIGLYRGELLPGFDEEWINYERLRLDDLYVFALRRLVDVCRQLGEQDNVLRFLRMALDRNRLDEALHIEIMSEYLKAQMPHRVVEQYEDLRTQLAEHLAKSPSVRAIQLANQARTEAKSKRPTPTPRKQVASSEAPELAPMRVVQLPPQVSRFCGRENEIAQVVSSILSSDARVTTVHGPAGTGKTRFSIEIGRRVGEELAWSVWFIPLADIPSGSAIIDTVLQQMRARRPEDEDGYGQLAEATRYHERVLLILDNLEHILEEAVSVIATMIERVPNLTVLTTSRQLLRLTAEHTFSLLPLPIPRGTLLECPIDSESLAQLASLSSVQVFVDRCQAIRPDFQLTLHNGRHIASICTKLEGVPLAIELAAGLSGTFTPAQMAMQLDQRLPSLGSRRRDVPKRHQSLRAAIDYSYETLSADLQSFFAALSVFRGGFTVDAAYEIAHRHVFPSTGDHAPRHSHHEQCLELLLELQERSLLRSDGGMDETVLRFRMLESFREYAEECLTDEQLDQLRESHAQYFQDRPAAVPHSGTPGDRTSRHLWIESEFENYLAALDYRCRSEAFEDAISLLGTLATTWTSRGPRIVERTTIRRIAEKLDGSDVSAPGRILLLRMLGTTHIRSMDYAAAYRVCETALAIATESGLEEQIAVCHAALSTCAGYLGDLDECAWRARRVLEQISDSHQTLSSRAHLALGAVSWGRGDMGTAEPEYRRAAELSAQFGDGEPDPLILYNIARLCLDTGRLDEAMITIGRAMQTCRRLHDEFGLATCLSIMSRYHWLMGNSAAALASGHEALLKFRSSAFPHWSQLGILQHALAMVQIGAHEDATVLFAATEGINKAARKPDGDSQVEALAIVRAQLSPAVFQRAWARGLVIDSEEAFRIALRYQ